MGDPIKDKERRDGPRIDLRLRVRYSVDELSGEAEASDVSPRGMRFEAANEVPAGSNLNMVIDAGDEEELKASGRVTWCRPRKSHSGRDMFDVGVAFDDDWLAQDRGPLGTALARIFAMNQYEPARSFERVKVSLQGSTSSSPPQPVEIVDISAGGMQLKATEGTEVKNGGTVIVEIEIDGQTTDIDGRVVWIAGDRERGPSFGVQFSESAESDAELLENIQKGKTEPQRITVFLQ